MLIACRAEPLTGPADPSGHSVRSAATWCTTDIAALVRAPQAAEQSQAVLDGTAHGLESLRRFEGMRAPHGLGAITNPKAYQDPSRKSAPSAKGALPAFSSAGGFGNPTRKFSP